MKAKLLFSNRFPLVLITLGVVSHWEWFVPGFQSRWGDNAGIPAAAFHQFGYSWLGWLSFSDLGSVNIQPYQLMFFQSWHVLAAIGINFATADQITILWPIAIFGLLSPFLFLRRLFDSDLAAFAGALVYGFSTSLLVLEGYETFLALGFSLLPLVLCAMDRLLERRTWSSLILLVLSFNLICYIDIRVAFLTLLLLFLYFFFDIRTEGRDLPGVTQILAGSILTLLLNSFWILVVLQSAQGSVARTTARTIFGNNFTNFQHAITLVSGSWVNGALQSFVLSPIPVIMWLMPTLAVLGALSKGSGRVLGRGSITVFGSLLAVGGVMLAKQVNPPIPSLYSWLYYNVPTFSLFRVGTDFFLVASLGYAVLIAKGFAAWHSSKSNLRAVGYYLLYPLALLMIISTIVVPLVDGKAGAVFVKRSRPSGLSNVTSLIQGNNTFYRTLWLPAVPDWSTYSLLHPAVGAINLLNPGQPLQHYVVPFGPQSVGMAIIQELSSDRGKRVLRAYSVKYIVLPPAGNSNTGALYRYYGEPRSVYSKWLSGVPWLKQLAGYKGGYSVYQFTPTQSYQSSYRLYSNPGQPLHIVNSDILVTQLPDTKVGRIVVPVSMLYNPNWHAYVLPMRDLGSDCEVSRGEMYSCNSGSGTSLLLGISSMGSSSVGGVRGPLGQLEFRLVPPVNRKNGASRDALVIVFGSALGEFLLLYLAELVFLALCTFLAVSWLVAVIRRSRVP